MKNETEHTPGPWTTSGVLVPTEHRTPGYRGCIVNVNYERKYPNSGLLAQVRAETVLMAEAKANANLICAAPDLLAALQILVEECELNGWQASLKTARAAIAKAEGK